MLVDCGTDCRRMMARVRLTHKDIDAIYISHLHADHVGGLEAMAFLSFFSGHRPTLFHALGRDLWDQQRYGLSKLHGATMGLGDYFKVEEIHRVLMSFQWEGLSIRAVPHRHISATCGAGMDSFGIHVYELGQANQDCLFITTDTNHPTELANVINSTLVLHDCETSQVPSGVHCQFDQLAKLPAQQKGKVWTYHYSAHPADMGKLAQSHGLAGAARAGQVFHLNPAQ